MFVKKITYEDLDGRERTDEAYFHFTEAELAEMESSVEGGLHAYAEKINKTENIPELMKLFKELISKAYGEKSADGRRFIKSEELSNSFIQSEAYSEMFMEFVEDPGKAAAFFNALVPAKLSKRKIAQESTNNVVSISGDNNAQNNNIQ